MTAPNVTVTIENPANEPPTAEPAVLILPPAPPAESPANIPPVESVPAATVEPLLALTREVTELRQSLDTLRSEVATARMEATAAVETVIEEPTIEEPDVTTVPVVLPEPETDQAAPANVGAGALGGAKGGRTGLARLFLGR